jgi:hypothetical protein
VKEEK